MDNTVQNGDGFISFQELKTVMASIGQRLSDEEVHEMMTTADINRDGKIDYAEFVKMMRQ
jgi:Ca2+-binding EF-hand superfamily protein